MLTMAHFAQTILLSILLHLISLNNSYYIIDNGANIRMISLSPNCDKGRIEFYNGTIFGTLTDCNQEFQLNNAKSICQNLGFEKEKEFWRGSINYDEDITEFNDAYIAYTQFNNCSSNLPNNNLCHNCLFQNNLNQCNSENLHQDYDIFVLCDNFGSDKKSSDYECIQHQQYEENSQYLACHDINNNNNNVNNNLESESSQKVIISIVGIAIFGSIFCVILFACYSKYKDNQHVSASNNINYTTKNLSPIGGIKNRNSGFSTVPTQGLELHTIDYNYNDDNDDIDDGYIPPPQPMFVYSTRCVDKEMNKEMNHNQYDNKYNMEEIIPSIIFSNNKSESESYGLLKKDDDNNDNDIDQTEKDSDQQNENSHD